MFKSLSKLRLKPNLIRPSFSLCLSSTFGAPSPDVKPLRLTFRAIEHRQENHSFASSLDLVKADLDSKYSNDI